MTKQTAEQAYATRMNEITTRMNTIQTLLAAHIEAGDELNWCHVGDLGHIAHKLHEVEAFLKNEDVE